MHGERERKRSAVETSLSLTEGDKRKEQTRERQKDVKEKVNDEKLENGREGKVRQMDGRRWET